MSQEKKNVVSCYWTLNFYVTWRYMQLVNIGVLWLLEPRYRRRSYLHFEGIYCLQLEGRSRVRIWQGDETRTI
jgi:hypothetical protein